MRRQVGMCVINRALVEDIAPLVGSQADVMGRLGISWNSWIKIAAGLPIRMSVGQRLKVRVLANAAHAAGFRRKFPSDAAPDGIDRAALDAAFLRPVTVPQAWQPSGPPLRSVRRAMEMPALYSAPAA